MLTPEELLRHRERLAAINDELDKYKRMERKAKYWQRKLTAEALPLRRIIRAARRKAELV
jgi:hypothetical protein